MKMCEEMLSFLIILNTKENGEFNIQTLGNFLFEHDKKNTFMVILVQCYFRHTY